MRSERGAYLGVKTTNGILISKAPGDTFG